SVLRDGESNYINSYNRAVTNSSWTSAGSIANSSGYLDPPTAGFPKVDPGFANAYDYPTIALYGIVSEVDANYNYLKDGSVQKPGTPVARHFAQDSYEFYVQDNWKIKSNFTVTLGLRWSLYSPPWETNGLEVTPTVNLGQWFNQRAVHMNQGRPSNLDQPVA